MTKQQTTAQPLLRTIPALLLLALSANVAHAGAPDSGIILQQTQPVLPAAPSKEGISLQQDKAATVQDSTPFMVNQIQITGNKVIDTATLAALVSSYTGSEHSITDLQQAAGAITSYYHAQGYPFARAVLPAQEIDNGTVRIQVIEAHYGNVSINNNSRVSDRLLQSTISPLMTGADIEGKTLDRTLLLLSDIPGIKPNATIAPGGSLGESDMSLDVVDAPMLAGRVTLDGYGNRFINRERVGASVSLFNPLGLGDVLSVSAITTGKRMQYGNIDYNLTLNGAGTRLGASYGALHYALGDNIAALRANGQAQTGSLWVKHPFVRSAAKNLYGTLQYNYADLEDRIDATGIRNDRHVKSYAATLNGDLRDGLLGGGINSMSIQFTNGRVKFDDPIAQTSDAVTAQTEGHFSKWNINLNRLQAIDAKTSLWLSASAQFANDNLDSSQKMVFGGPFSVRAYDTGAVSGDSGSMVTIELRRVLGNFHGLIQGVAFADVGRVEVNDKRWATATGKNKASLSGVGVGVNWFGNNQWAAKASLATSTGSRSSLTKNADNSIAWIEISKGF